MKTIPMFLSLALLTVVASAQTTIFNQAFDGSSSTSLNGTAEDYSGVTWSAVGINQDGSTTAQGGAMLAHDFTTGTYEVVATTTTFTTFLGIGFTTSDPVQGAYVTNTKSYASFAIRNTGEFTYWEGPGNANANSGGFVQDYNGGDSGYNTRVGTLRLVLDWDATSKTGTIAGYYTPSGGLNAGTEFQVDLDSSSASMTNTVSGVDLTGVGLTYNGATGGKYSTFTVTAIPESSTFPLVGGVIVLVLCLLFRQKTSRK